MVPEEGQIPANGRKMIPNMIHNVNTTRNSAYNYSITYEKPQSKLKDMGGSKVLTETNDADNDVYRNAATKATMIAKVDRYSQGTFDVSLLIGGNNANSYFTGKLYSATDVDYFHVDTMSQMMNHRPVIINMEMPERADYDLTVYDEAGNQVGIAVENEDGTKTLTIPCDWSNSHNFVIKVSQNGSEEYVEGNYKLTFSQGEMPQEDKDALERIKTAKLVEGDPKRRAELGAEIKAKYDARNVAETEKLHQAQYDALPEELQYKGSVSVEELLEKEMQREPVTEAERAYIAIYGNQNDIYQVECQKMKQGLEQEFSAYLESLGLSDKEFSIHLETGGKAEVSGLDEAQKEQVENYIESHWEQFKNVYLTSSDECTEMTDQEYRIAGYMEECNRFLSNASGGKVSVDDLSIERKVTGWYINSENIVGLPLVIASALNSADSTDKYYDYKQMIHSILNYKQQNGEIPQYHMDFKWSGKELQC